MDNVPESFEEACDSVEAARTPMPSLVEIRDHGAGLSDFDKPFRSFYTTERGREWVMGLAICRPSSMPIAALFGPRQQKARGDVLPFSPSSRPGKARRLETSDPFLY